MKNNIHFVLQNCLSHQVTLGKHVSFWVGRVDLASAQLHESFIVDIYYYYIAHLDSSFLQL